MSGDDPSTSQCALQEHKRQERVSKVSGHPLGQNLQFRTPSLVDSSIKWSKSVGFIVDSLEKGYSVRGRRSKLREFDSHITGAYIMYEV
jgi:hypothetical protein